MKNKIAFLSSLLVMLLLFAMCDDDNEKKCTYVELVTVESGCYDSNEALTLTAFGRAKDNNSDQWEVWVLREKTDGMTPNDFSKYMYGKSVITLEDDILLDNEQVLTRISTYCDGQILYSKYFRFIKDNSGNCPTWIASDL